MPEILCVIEPAGGILGPPGYATSCALTADRWYLREAFGCSWGGHDNVGRRGEANLERVPGYEKVGDGFMTVTSLGAHGQALARLGAFLAGAGASASGLSTDSYSKSATRWAGLLGADLAVGPGTLRLLGSYAGPIRDENRLRGLGASWRYEAPLSSRASLRGGMGVNWWTVTEPWGETDRVTWLSTLGVTFGGVR